MKRFTKYIVFALIGLFVIGTFVYLYKNSQPEKIRYKELETAVMDIHRTTVVTGKITPRNEVNVKPQISGIISELYKEPGDYVNAGDVIAKVKVVPEMGQLSSAEMRVRLSEINLKQSE